jgi:hypothetical protein
LSGGVRPNQRSGTRAVSSKNPKKKTILRAAFRFITEPVANACVFVPGFGDVVFERWFGRPFVFGEFVRMDSLRCPVLV